MTERKVTEVTFTLVVDGRPTVWTFLRKDKIDDLLTAEDVTLGAWLRGLRDCDPPESR